ncbi:MAG TPA: hypothetical protein PLH57_01325 [Oligoflexia bacterium]|nr:hypothetical protein [Oligoflexia bacterium]
MSILRYLLFFTALSACPLVRTGEAIELINPDFSNCDVVLRASEPGVDPRLDSAHQAAARREAVRAIIDSLVESTLTQKLNSFTSPVQKNIWTKIRGRSSLSHEEFTKNIGAMGSYSPLTQEIFIDELYYRSTFEAPLLVHESQHLIDHFKNRLEDHPAFNFAIDMAATFRSATSTWDYEQSAHGAEYDFVKAVEQQLANHPYLSRNDLLLLLAHEVPIPEQIFKPYQALLPFMVIEQNLFLINIANPAIDIVYDHENSHEAMSFVRDHLGRVIRNSPWGALFFESKSAFIASQIGPRPTGGRLRANIKRLSKVLK